MDQQVGDLEEVGLLGQLLDGVAAVLEDALLAVDEGDRALARGGVDEAGVVGREARAASSSVLIWPRSAALMVPSVIGISYSLPVRLSRTVRVLSPVSVTSAPCVAASSGRPVSRSRRGRRVTECPVGLSTYAHARWTADQSGLVLTCPRRAGNLDGRASCRVMPPRTGRGADPDAVLTGQPGSVRQKARHHHRPGNLARAVHERGEGIQRAHVQPQARVTSSASGTSSTPPTWSWAASPSRPPTCCAASTSPCSPPTSTPVTSSSSSTPRRCRCPATRRPRRCPTATPGYPGGLSRHPDGRAAREGRPQGHREGRLGHAPQEPPRSPDAQEAQGVRRPEHPHPAQKAKPFEITQISQ